jgi:ribose 5-phosphate isomerase A
MSAPELIRRFKALGANAVTRSVNGQPLVTDNGQYVLDVKGLQINEPLAFEDKVSQWPGVVTVGVFAHQHAHVCLLGTPEGVQTILY